MSEVPEGCTLATQERPLRVAEFDALFSSCLVQVHRPIPGRLVLTLEGPDGLRNQVQDLAAREASCCSFFTFDVAVAAGVVLLTIDVPADRTGVLDGLAARALAAFGSD